MEDYNDTKKITGSPTAGESEFVHVEPIDLASMNGNSINQDDGIMVTRVDTVQLEPNDQRLTEDGGNEEFVDCPDDLISLDGKSDFDENIETELVLEGQQTNGDSTEILPHHYQEEKRQLMAEITELTNIRHQLLIEQSQKDETIRQIYANLDLKDREIEDLNIKSNRILSIFTTVFGDEEFPDTSVSGKLTHIEKKASFMIQKYNRFLYEVEMLNQCLTEVKSDYHMQTEMEKILFFVRDELLSLKRKEFDLAHKSKHLEDEYGKLMQELLKSNETVEMLKGEVEVHKTKFINTKEKLNLAVTKGKSLVQQRDLLKKAVFEKTDELDKCLIDLQEKSRDLEAANSLMESLLQRDIILKKCEEILAFGEEVQGQNLESRISWLLESLNIAKNESIGLQNEINTTKEAARDEIDRLTVSLLVEVQEKNYLEQEFANLKSENGSLQIDLKRSEDKTVLLREKLSMAVKKGKSLVQERAEKNAQIEALKLELENQETTINDCRDQISKLSKDVGQIEKLEYDILCLKEENNQIEALKLELKQQEAQINDYKDQISKLLKDVGYIEKLESDILCLKEENTQIEVLKLELKQQEDTINNYRDQISKLSKDLGWIEKLESDILCLKEENNQIEAFKLELKQQEATINDYRDQNSKLSKDVGRIENLESELLCLKEERNQIEALKLELKQQEATINDYRDQISKLSKDVGQIEKLESDLLYLKEENNQIEPLKLELEQQEATINDYRDQMREFSKDAGQIEKLELDILCLKEENYQIEPLKLELGQQEATINEYRDQISKFSKEVGRIEKLESDLLCLQEEKNQAEPLKRELKQQEATINDYRDQISKLSKDVGQIEKLQSDLLCLKEERNQIEQFLVDINHPVDLTGPVDKVKWCVTYINECKLAKAISDQELRDLKDETDMLTRKLTDALTTIKSLEDALSVSKKHVFQLTEENKELKVINDIKVKEKVSILEDANEKAVNDIKVVLSACADVTKEMKIILEKLNHNSSLDIGAVDDVAVADTKVVEEMMSAARNVRSVIEHCFDEKQYLSATIEDLQAELEKSRSTFEKVKEENDILQNRVFKLENGIEELQNVHDEMSTKLVEHRAKEAELSKQITAYMKDYEAENNLLSTSEVKSLFKKINGITIPFPNIPSGEKDTHDSNPIQKLFYIIDNVNELLDHITLLSHSKKDLQSTLSKQTLEIEHLKKELEEAVDYKKELEKTKKELFELSVGVEHVIRKFGGYESDADVAGLLPVLERFITEIILDSENSKGKAKEFGVRLLDTQKVVEELENKIKLFEDSNQNQAGLIDSIRERGDSERSEILEVEDSGPLGKRVTPLVRTLRRETNDQLVLNIDSESDHLINKHESVEDKGHIFKSLHTSGLVPAQGKIIADRLDGLWVSGGGALMSRPRARLGFIAYWVVLHLWLFGTLL